MPEIGNGKESVSGFLHMLLLLPSLREATSEFNEVQAQQRGEGAIFSQVQGQDVNNVPPSTQTELSLYEHNCFFAVPKSFYSTTMIMFFI